MAHPFQPRQRGRCASKVSLPRLAVLLIATAPLLLGGSLAMADTTEQVQAEKVAAQEARIIEQTSKKMTDQTSKLLDRAVRRHTTDLMLEVQLEAQARAAMRATLAKRVEDRLRRSEKEQTSIARR